MYSTTGRYDGGSTGCRNELDGVSMNFLRVRRIAERLEFLDQLLVPATAIDGRGKLERESRGLKTNYAGIVAAQVLEEPHAQVVSLANVNAKRIEETVGAGGFGRVFQDKFALNE